MEAIVRAIDVGFGNTKFVTGVGGGRTADIRCSSYPSRAYPSWRDPSKALGSEARKTEELEEKLKELHAMKATLEHLVHCCHGDDRPDCPIIETLAQDSAAPPPNGHGKTAGLRPGRHGRRTS
jgi:hypothetical protein